MTTSAGLDPFTVFGIEHRLDLDLRSLERRYLQLSRDCHPDLHRAQGAADCAAVLARAAEINDAWKLLRDPWERARTLVELRAPGAMLAQRALDPEFLATALELAEEVAFAEAGAIPALQSRLQAMADAQFATLARATTAGDYETAARTLHESRYVRKALADLAARTAGAHS